MRERNIDGDQVGGVLLRTAHGDPSETGVGVSREPRPQLERHFQDSPW
jgi:hypothetical protein